MKIKWGALVTEGRGKLGGHVASKNKSGAILRTKVTPVNPQTSAQASARSRLGGNSQAWSGLSEDQRTGWNALAKETSKTNIFGDQYFPSGKNLFTSVNNNLVMLERAQITDAPVFAELPFIIDMTVAVDISAGEIDLTIQVSGTVTGNALVIEATAPSSAGKYNFDGSYRQIMVSPSGAVPTPIAIQTAYVAKFGNPVGNKKIAFRAYYVSNSGGNASPRFTASTVVMP